MRDIALSKLRDPAAFWIKLTALRATTSHPPHQALRALLPERGMAYRVVLDIIAAAAAAYAQGGVLR